MKASRGLWLAMMILGLGAAEVASAGIYLEPYVGVSLSGKSTPSTGSEVDLSGTAFGARLGWQVMGLRLGAEYQGAALKAKTTPIEGTGTSTSLGASLGYKFPVMFHIYGTYFFSSEAGLDVGSNSIKNKDGGGYKVGIGYTGLPFVAINLEMLQLDYGKQQISGFSETTLSPKDKNNLVLLTLSFPFSF